MKNLIALLLLLGVMGTVSCAVTEKPEITAIKERVKFSDSFLKEFPDIYQDLVRLDAQGKFDILKRINEHDAKDNYKYKGKVTNQDITALIGELLEDIWELTEDQKTFIVIMISGDDANQTPYSAYDGWWQPIPESIPHLIKLLGYKIVDCGWVGVVLVNLGAKDKVPNEVIKDIRRIAWIQCDYSNFPYRAREALRELGEEK